jgi:hypothetical protein
MSKVQVPGLTELLDSVKSALDSVAGQAVRKGDTIRNFLEYRTL